jgi:hypothetical protein
MHLQPADERVTLMLALFGKPTKLAMAGGGLNALAFPGSPTPRRPHSVSIFVCRSESFGFPRGP